MDSILHIHNNLVHTSTKFVPYELIFGRMANEFKDYNADEKLDEVATLVQRVEQEEKLSIKRCGWRSTGILLSASQAQTSGPE